MDQDSEEVWVEGAAIAWRKEEGKPGDREREGNPFLSPSPGGGGTLGISGWGCAAGTLEPLTYTRASSAKFCYPILE